MSDCGFALDPEYLTKKTHVSWSRNILDLKKAGIRNTDIIVRADKVIIYGMTDLQEFLSYTKAGTEVELVIYRAEKGEYKEMVIRVTLDKRPTRSKS